MKKFKVRKYYSRKKVIIASLILIFFLTSIFLEIYGKKTSDDLLNITNNLINTVMTNSVNSNIKLDLIKKYKINELIDIEYQDKKISNVNYNLEKAYEILIYIKKEIINTLNDNMPNIYNYYYEIQNNKIIVSMPYYNNSNNILISNFGPKIFVQISFLELIDGSIKTKIKTYGINSLLVELYLNILITNTIVIPNNSKYNNHNEYNILISSKIVQGEIPSIYNGLFESKSDTIIT